MQATLRGVIGLGVTLLVLGAGMMTVNGLGRGWAAHKLARDPDNAWAGAVLILL